jgi:nickel-dependent lactate racemase
MPPTSIEPASSMGPNGGASVQGLIPGASAIAIPWGPDGSLGLRWPESGPLAGAAVEVIAPDLADPVADYPAALGAALGSPVDAPRLEDQVVPGRSVAIVVDDPSRWTPVREALPMVLARLHAAGVRPEDVTISVGVGRHHAVDAESMRRRVGEAAAAGYRCFSPPVDDLSAYVELGTVDRGVPVRVFRPVAEADLRILIGSVLPHLQAGFGGGYKLILPGTSHRATLGALHRQGLVGRGGTDAAGLLGGDAADNPMRRAIHAAAGLLGPCWSISHLIGGPEQVFRVIAGRPERVQDLLAAEARRRFETPPPAAGPAQADVVVAGNHPWPGDPMQSFKVLLHHRAACRPGGALVGLFWTDPAEIGRSFPVGALRRIAATGALGAWAIRRLIPAAQHAAALAGSPAAFMIRWARELVVDRTVLVYAPPLRERIGPRLGPVRLFSDLDELWDCLARCARSSGQWSVVSGQWEGLGRHAARGGQPLRVRIFPQGGLTYVPRSAGDALPAPVFTDHS